MTFQKEHSYSVIKFSDADAALTEDESEQLADLMAKVEWYSIEQGKTPLECVVVESDWPIYDATWDAVEHMAGISKP